MMHVGWRIVKPEGHLSLHGCCGQLRHDVLAIRGVCDFVVRVGGVEHAETVMVLRSKDHVFLACCARQSHESVRIEFCWIEPLWQFAVLRFADAAWGWPHDGPGGFHTGERVRAPVDE